MDTKGESCLSNLRLRLTQEPEEQRPSPAHAESGGAARGCCVPPRRRSPWRGSAMHSAFTVQDPPCVLLFFTWPSFVSRRLYACP